MLTLAKQGRRGRLPEFDLDEEGPLSLRGVEYRVLRALKTLRAVPDPDHKILPGFYGSAIAWPSVVHDFFDAYSIDSDDVKVKLFRPKPADVSDMLTALSWLNHLTKQYFRLIWWRSFDLSFKQMAENLHRSDETARARYNEAIRLVWLAAQQKEAESPWEAEAQAFVRRVRSRT